MRIPWAATAYLFLFMALVWPQTTSHPPFPKKTGITDAGVSIPLANLIPEAIFQLGGAPDWIAIGEDVWISNKPSNRVSRLDVRSNIVKQTITGFSKPCSGLVIAFGSLWVPNCGDSSLVRVDLATGAITARIPTTIADSEGGITAGAGSVWLVSNGNSTLVQIDPASNRIAAQISLPQGCYVPEFGFGSVWISCTGQNSVVRVDPATKQTSATIPTGPQPRFLTAGEGAVWTLNQGDGTVTRISPTNNHVEQTIPVGIPGEGGDISAGEGSVWATSFGFPLSRIDPRTNKVMQQFVGLGGDAIRAGRGLVMLSNYKPGTEWKLDPVKVAAIKAE